MGKKSLIKSTSKKKKTTSKKKDVDKKSKPSKKGTATKKEVSQKTPAKKKSVASKKVSKKKADLKTLIFKKFEREIPDKLFTVEAEKRTYSAPPLIASSDPKEVERLKALLFKKIDLTDAEEKKKPEKAVEPIKAPVKEKEKPEKIAEEKPPKKDIEKKVPKKVDYREIMARKFHEPLSEEKLMKGKVEQEKTLYTAPPLISTDDKKEAARIREILFKQFEIPPAPVETQPPEPEEPPAVEAEKVEEVPGPEQKAAVEAPPEKVHEAVKEEEPEVPPEKVPEAVKEEEPEVLPEKIPEAVKEEEPEVPPEKVPEAVKEEEPEVLAEEKVPEAIMDQKIAPETDKTGKEKPEKEEKGPKVTISYDEPPPTDTEVSDPMNKMIKVVAAVIALIFLIIIGSSFSNQSKYYIQPVKDGIEVLKGRFAPMGEEVLARLDGVAPPETIKEVYQAHEVLPMLFSYFVDQADALLSANAIPDLKAVKGKLDRALSFASTKEDRAAVYSRINLMEKLVLQYRANVAVKRGTPADLAIAIGLLNNALKLDIDEQQKSLIQSRIEYLQEYRNELLAQEEAMAAEQAEKDQVAAEEEAAKDEAADAEKSEGGHD